VAAASGLLAYIKIPKIQLAQSEKAKKLTATTGSGQALFSADFEGRAVGLGWTFAESLIVVLEDGNVISYNLMGEQTCFQLQSYGKIIHAKIFSTGLVALTDSYEFIAVSDLSEPRPKVLKSPGLTCEPESWIVIPPHLSGSKHVEVLMSSFDLLMLIDSSFILEQRVDGHPFKKMALSPNGSLIALFSETGTLYVYTIDFQKCLASIHTNKTLVPLEMEWCGNDSVVLHWNMMLWVVGPSGDWISYNTLGRVHLMSEIDGVRIISGSYSEFLQKVPSCVESVFRIGSTSPGAVLYDAMELYENRNPKAEECIRSLSKDLEYAVDTCIEAAADEFEHDIQKQLMRAASFGKCFLQHYPADKFVEKCRIIRVLNAIRDPLVGLYLTHGEYCYCTLTVGCRTYLTR
jgi:WD40 repeat protein